MKIQNEPIQFPKDMTHEIFLKLDITDFDPLCFDKEWKKIFSQEINRLENIQFVNKFGNSPLHLVFEESFFEDDISFRTQVIETIIIKQKNCYVQNDKGETPLHSAIKNTAKQLEKLSNESDFDKIQSIRNLIQANTQLINKMTRLGGPDLLNWKDLNGQTAFDYSSKFNSQGLQIFFLNFSAKDFAPHQSQSAFFINPIQGDTLKRMQASLFSSSNEEQQMYCTTGACGEEDFSEDEENNSEIQKAPTPVESVEDKAPTPVESVEELAKNSSLESETEFEEKRSHCSCAII